MSHDSLRNDSLRKDHASPFGFTAFFEGRTRAHGVFEDRFARLKRRLSVDMHGTWRNGIFVLDEQFEYDDGATETRQWLVTPTGPSTFGATCDDCLGHAEGQHKDGEVRMAYRFWLKIGGRRIAVSMDDRIYSLPGGGALNRATMSKWGVRLGELALTFVKA